MSGVTPPDKPKRFSMIRDLSLADAVTLSNAACGTGAIFACLSYLGDGRDPKFIWYALILLPIAFVADVGDGFVARWRNRSSPYGADLDSLADIVSFGVAPAVLAYTLGMRGFLDIVVLIYFVACGISRLARFNVTAEALSEGSNKVKYFEGTPIPTSLALVMVLGAAFYQGAYDDTLWGGALSIAGMTFHPIVLLYGLSGTLMASAAIRIPKP